MDTRRVETVSADLLCSRVFCRACVGVRASWSEEGLGEDTPQSALHRPCNVRGELGGMRGAAGPELVGMW